VGRVQLYIAASLDGFIADDHGEVEWLERFNVDGEDHGYGRFMSHVGAVVMGGTTYEQELERGSWPYGELPVWVFTHRDLPTPPGAAVRFARGPVSDVVEEIRHSTDRNVFLVGGARLVEQFLEANAIDELMLFVVPVLLGGGTRLFERVVPAGAELLDTHQYDTGLVDLHYRLRPSTA
jgi:dihydrofolate reductase